MDREVLKEMEKALKRNKTLEKLTLYYGGILLKEFCRHILFGIRQNTSLSEVYLNFEPINWDCPVDGRFLVYVSHSCVTQLDVVYSVYQAMVRTSI